MAFDLGPERTEILVLGLEKRLGMGGRQLLALGQAILCFGLSAFVGYDLGWDDGFALIIILAVVGVAFLAQALGIGLKRK